MPDLTYVIGEPGVGKSTLVQAALEGLWWHRVDKPFAHMIYKEKVVQLGRNKNGFNGTDALSMSVQPKVLDWLKLEPYDLVIAEGDRLATGSFFTRVIHETSYDLTIVLLKAPADLVERRRTYRARYLGVKPQDESWVAGRRTKVKHLAEVFPVIEVDASSDADAMLRTLSQVPVFRELEVLRGGV